MIHLLYSVIINYGLTLSTFFFQTDEKMYIDYRNLPAERMTTEGYYTFIGHRSMELDRLPVSYINIEVIR